VSGVEHGKVEDGRGILERVSNVSPTRGSCGLTKPASTIPKHILTAKRLPKFVTAADAMAIEPHRNINIGMTTAGENCFARTVAGILKVPYGT
jgi:hypothetical protein